MKEKDANVNCEDHQMTVFVEKDDGSYGPMQTGSYMVKNYIDKYWQNMEHFKEKALGQLQNNEISPIAFYMVLREMAAADVAVRIGISTAQVKKHMLPDHFKKMNLDIAQKYADIFGIPLANLFQVSIKSGFVDPAVLQQTETKNPFVITIE